MSIIGLDESWKLRTHKKLEAILSQLWSFTIPANMPNQETTSLKLFISEAKIYNKAGQHATADENMRIKWFTWLMDIKHD